MNQIKMNADMIDTIVKRWTDRTATLSDEGPHLPVDALLGEAMDVAEFIETNFHEQSSKGIVKPGLAAYVKDEGFTAETSTELRELQLAAGTIESRYQNLVQKEEGTTIEEAEELIRELRAALSFVLEDGDHPAGEEQLVRLRDKETVNRSQDGVALVLDNYRELAREYAKELSAVPDYDAGLVDKAIAVAQGLRQRSADALSGNTARQQRELLSLRNRFLTAIAERVKESRRVIRYVFRDHPDLVKKATSRYARTSKRRARQVSDVSEVGGGEGVELEEVTAVPAGTVG